MRVECKSIQDFLLNLDNIAMERVIESTIRVSISENREGVKYYVNFQASALIQLAEYDGQYLLEFGADCGRDIRGTSDPDFEGTSKAMAFKAEVIEMCDKKGWTTLPGVISI